MSDYDNAYRNDTRDLLDEAAKKQLPSPQFREQTIQHILESFGLKRSVLLVGPAGVGKTSIIYGLAYEMRQSRHRDLRELSTLGILSGTRYLGDWQSKAKVLFDQANKKKAVFYFTDVWNLRSVGSSSADASTIFDFMQGYLQAGKLLIIGEVTDQQYALMQRHPTLASIFDVIQIPPLSKEQQQNIVLSELDQLQLQAEQNAVARVFDLCGQFQAHSDGPGPALRLLRQVAHYQKQKKQINEPEVCDAKFVDKVFSIYSGLPLFIISRHHVKPVSEIRDWFSKRIIGQNEAIEAVLETIALYKAGLHDAKRPISTFLFVGPTGVGKTELAKALAAFLFGNETRLLRFDMSEFKDYSAFEALVGCADNQTKPARLLDPVKAQPFQVILFDEIEKAHGNVWNLLLQLLDEGRLTSPRGGTVNFRNTIIIATSNVGAREMNSNSIGFSESESDSSDIRKHLEKVFRPELINRFQHISSFHGLTKKDVRQIAKREMDMVLSREGINSRNLIVEVDDDVLDHVVDHGYDKQYGARALKRELQRRVVSPIAHFLLENPVYSGALLKLDIVRQRTRVRLIETEESRVHKLEAQPVSIGDGKRYTLNDVRQQCEELQAKHEELAGRLDEAGLHKQLNDYDEQRNKAGFWDNREQAYRQMSKAEVVVNKLARLEKLKNELDDIQKRLKGSPARDQIAYIARQIAACNEKQTGAWRELCLMSEEHGCDAIIQIQPIANKQQSAAAIRDLLFETYHGWADVYCHSAHVICEPLCDEDCASLWLQGSYVYGYLKSEAGLHRMRDGEHTQIARVTVAALNDVNEAEFEIGQRNAFKQNGAYGGRIRSRLEINHSNTAPNLVLQNSNILNVNYKLAGQLAPSWNQMAYSSDDIIRRYDVNPFLVRDPLVKLNSGKPDLLKAESFHKLICRRVDRVFAKR